MRLVSILTRHKRFGNKSILGTGHYSSPVGGVGEEGEGGSLDFWENKRGNQS